MVALFVATLERPVSRIRLESYRPDGGSDLEMVTNYFYNIELSEAFYPCLQAFEIALRNSVDFALTRHFNSPYWFDTPSLLPLWQQRELANARRSLAMAGKPQDPGRIIAELKLGFWHSLFNAPFERDLWRPNKSAMILEVFPQISGKKRNRQIIYGRIDRIRKLRNRVMHFEPIWHSRQISDDHALILETIQWISVEMHETIAMSDRFNTIHKDGRQSVERRILDEIQRRYPNAALP